MFASFIVVVVVVAVVAVVLVVAVYKRSLSKRTTVIQESILGADSTDGGRRFFTRREQSCVVGDVAVVAHCLVSASTPAQAMTRTARARC